jgi:hypothetical protein
MTAKRIDDLQPEIVLTLRKTGCTVLSLAAVGKGCPDLLVGFAGRLYLLEVKSEHGHLTGDQVIFHNTWYQHVQVVHNELEALRAIGAMVMDSEI